jgi:hypothetical protein
LKQRHFDVQLIGGIVLHQGKIAEMNSDLSWISAMRSTVFACISALTHLLSLFGLSASSGYFKSIQREW